MDTTQFIMGSIAFFGTLALVVGMALTIHWGRNRDTGLMPYFFYPSLLSSALFVLASNRDVSVYLELLKTVAPVEKSPAALWVGRLTSLFILFAFSERLLHRLFGAQKNKPVPRALIWALLVFFLTNVISPGLFGSHPALSHENFYAVIACLAMLLMNDKEVVLAFHSARNAMFLFLLIGLILIPVIPREIIATNYSGLIPLLKVRLSGLSNHPNGLGVLAIGAIFCLWKFPFQNRYLNRLAWLVGLSCLILSQSKTSWIAFLCSAPFIVYFTYDDQLKRHFLNYRRPSASLILISSGMVALLTLFIAFSFMDLGDRINGFFNSRTGSDLLTLTGRDIIWQIALEEWHKSPVFGYGLSIWDEDFRRSIQMAHAVSAHSQFYQSLSTAGIVGVAGLLTYFSVLLHFSWTLAKKTGGLSMAMFTLIFMHSLSESGFGLDGFGAEPIIEHALLLIILAGSWEPKRAVIKHARPDRLNMKGWA